jgi:hypothetical protein
VIDWDGDGDLDLLSGCSNGGVQWAENKAGRGTTPELAPFQSLIRRGPQIEYGQILREDDLSGPTSSTRVWVDDVNSDGKLDLLVGDSVTLISPAENVSDEAFKEKFAAWQKSFNKAVEGLNSGSADEAERNKANELFQKVYSERSQSMKEDSTGFVWLYLQK